MYLLNISTSSLLISCIVGISQGLILDSSCNTYSSLLTTSFNHAFKAAANAGDQLNANTDPDTLNLAHMLFGQKENWSEAGTRLAGAKNIPWSGTFTTDKTDRSNTHNIIIYCNLDRYTLSTDPQHKGLYLDPDNGIYSAVDGTVYEQCKTGSAPSGEKLPKVLTSNFRILNLRVSKPLTTMEICPWYLQKVAASEWKMGSDLNLLGVLGQVANLPALLFGPKTDMDTLSLFDYTILHELTHSRACGIPQRELQIPESYGWNACVKAKNPRNSESLAMYALGVEKIQAGYTILEDGQCLTRDQVNLIDPPPSPDSMAGHSDGSVSSSSGDPDSPAAGSGSTSPGNPPSKREIGITAKKGFLVAAQEFEA